MTEKRFIIVHLRTLDSCDIQDTMQEIPTFYNDLGHRQAVEPLVDLLNALYNENEQLKAEIQDFQTLLADKEEELLKPVIRMIDEKIEEVDTISKETLKDLRKQIME